MTRYAIYFAPAPDTALWRFGSRVIGYDAATPADCPPPDCPPPDGSVAKAADWARLTADPRRYGFHATLKAPFELADGVDEAALLSATGTLAKGPEEGLDAVTLGALQVAEIGRFIALVPVERSEPLQLLARTVVERLEPLRAPLSAPDRARRLAARLTGRQITHLERYGYPYVLDDFRFHMTLTGPIEDPLERADVRRRLAAAYAAAVPLEAVTVDALTVFRQAGRDERFEIIARFPLLSP